MEKLKVIIADDEKDAIEVLRNIFNDFGNVEIVKEIVNPLKIESSLNRYKPDALFLDVEMPGQNGLSLLENVREYNQEIPVIYVTAFDKYIENAIKLNVFSYMLKPVDRTELYSLVEKLIKLKQKSKPPQNLKIKLPVKGGLVYLNPSDLFMLEAEGSYTRLKTVRGEEFISSYNMGRLFDKLQGETFFRINRSCILNGEFIYKINKNKNTCLVRLNEKEMEFEVSGTFITAFNRTIK